jgi:opacity protein-like surface antigen
VRARVRRCVDELSTIRRAHQPEAQGMQTRLLLLAFLTLPLASCATSTPRGPSGFYARANLGYGQTLDGAFDPSGASADGEYSAGLVSGAAVGYDLDERWSVEADWTYRSGEIDTIGANGSLANGGDYASVAVTSSVIYSFPASGPWRPYVGAGLGFLQEIDADLEPSGDEVSDRGGLAYQFLAGVGYRASEALEVTLEGRYLGTSGVELEGGGQSFEADYEHLGVLLGLRWLF